MALLKKILIVSPITCYPPFFGNSARIAAFIAYLQQADVDFRYLHLPESPFDPAPMQAKLGDKYLYETYRPRKEVIYKLRIRAIQSLFSRKPGRIIKIDDFVQRQDIARYKKALAHFKPDTVLINYTYLSRLFDYTPSGIERILDTHDSLHLRFKQLYQKGPKLGQFRIDVRDEIWGLNRAHKVISIQSAETQFFQSNGCLRKLYTIGHLTDYRPGPVNEHRYKLLYIGAHYSANVDALHHFITDIWPLLLTRYPQLTCYIAGGIVKAFPFLSTDKNIQLLGYVTDLAALYGQVDIAINPVRNGSGLKIKNIEALSYGVPVVTTTIGADGLTNFQDRGLYIAHTPVEWVQKIGQLCNTDSRFYTDAVGSIAVAFAEYTEANKQQLHHLFTDSYEQ